MRANRGRDTKPEIAVRSAVHRAGLRYRVSAPPERDLRRTADLLFRRGRVAVFIDGCYWHGCEQHYSRPSANKEFWSDKLTRNVRRDSDTNQRLIKLGWAVIRAWEHEDPEAVAQLIIDVVADRRSGFGEGTSPFDYTAVIRGDRKDPLDA